MKNSIKRAQSRAGSSFAERLRVGEPCSGIRENFRPKVKQLKKTLLTLVALLALTTQAWAESKPIGLNVEYAAGDVITTNSTGDVYIWWGYYLSGEDIQEGAIKITSSVSPTISMLKISDSTGYIQLVDNYSVYDKDGNIIQEDPEIQCQGMVTGTTLEKVYVKSGSGTLADPYVFAPGSAPAAASGPEVAWDKATKTGQFTMPGGNVTLEPEYYPQAALTAAPTAINDVPATTDGAIVKAGTVANIGSTETAQGTVMYYVSPTALDDAALLALAADQWKADVPTAKSLTKGEAYVYYYVRGNDSDTDEENFSDGDILAANALTVTIAAEPTYAVTFAEGTDPDEWKAEPNTAKKGQQVTVTYEGPRKVMGVKAEKKKVAEGHALSASAVGEIVGTDGKAYAAADKDILPSGVTAVAMVAYKSETTGSSLAIALADESNSDWNTAKSTCEGKSAVTNAAWLLPSQNQWKAMFSANGGNEGQYTGLNTAITTAGGTALQGTPPYWSSTPSGYDDGTAYNVLLGGGGAEWYRDYYEETRYRVRACLAF